MCIVNAKWKLNTMFFTDDTVFIAENEKGFAKISRGVKYCLSEAEYESK